MPKMDGLEMCKEIKRENQNQRIILFTSYNEVEHLSEAININVDKYIMKPLNSRQLFDTLDEVLDDLKRERKEEAYKQDLEFASNHDLLTGLANRKLFFTKLQPLVKESIREKKAVAILSMDLNKFKPINDTYGHDAGDLILKKVAQYLQKSLRKSDIISRFGGDEFVIAVGFLKENDHILKFLGRLERNFSEPVVYQDDDGAKHYLDISFSMGITFSSPTVADPSFDKLLREADKAMYRAKELGVPYAFYDPNEESKFKIKAKKSQELKDAIDRGEFLLYYQPIINLQNREIVAFEALLRWRHPQKSILTPDKFLPYIWNDLEIGLYLARWVIEQVFIEQNKLSEKNRDILIGVNISFLEFNAKEFIPMVKEIMDRYPMVSPSKICFEIDEETAIQDIELGRSRIKTVKELGFKVALDDFGIGSSTLAHLQKFDIDTIKIDKSFVIDMLTNGKNHSIVDASIKLAKAFNYKVVAIGVESKEHLPDLLRLGCDEAQGYGIEKPSSKLKFDI